MLKAIRCASPFFSLYVHSRRSPEEFNKDYLRPSPGACEAVPLGLDDVFYTAPSDLEDFRPTSADAVPPSGQEVWPSAAYTELVDMLVRATKKISMARGTT